MRLLELIGTTDMYIERNRHAAKCRICGRWIYPMKDDFRVYCVGTNGHTYFHIGCVIDVGNLLGQIDIRQRFKQLEDSVGYPIDSIGIDRF